MSAPKEILNLVKRFDENRDAYLSGEYSEAQVRVDFIDPFFKALGWDVNNERGYSEAYREVVHEDSIRIGSYVKAPDACFRIGGVRKFFVECKKPSVNIKESVHAAYQLRRYAWSAKLPLGILTDFDEFAVYDCRIKPYVKDKPSTARTRYLTYKDYPDSWDEIASIFSREAILKGSFDRYVEKNKAKRGTAEVDDAFLEEIERWRDLLAHRIAVQNPKLTQRELNFSVQQTIDRIIFLRICEDRGVEHYGALMALQNGSNLYKRLMDLFYKADQRYNSGLFHFTSERGREEVPDELTPHLKIDDKTLKDILQNLYYPDSPYEFSVLPADILGQVYERFLGKVISLTAGHQARVEEKPEVRKAGGVYYTPTYIVDYIVKNTVDKLLEGKSPKDIAKLRILDPACGSGSFLIVAYQHLLDWHLDRYVKDDPQKHKKELYQAGVKDWRLTTAERKRILLNNIYGVDIDPQAVEVTKLSLLLKVLEGENQQTLDKQFKLFHERALPDLAQNIKCGNSLIGSDFYEQQQMTLPCAEERYHINVFDWQTEFTPIFKTGGFDAVIGNPPYIRSQSLGDDQRMYYGRKFQTATATYDIYVLFVERALSLISKHGRVGFILPNKFFTTDYGVGLRNLLTKPNRIERIVDFEDGQVFSGAGTYTCLLFMTSQVSGEIDYVRFGTVFREQGENGVATLLKSGKLGFEKLTFAAGGERWTLAVGAIGRLLTKLQKNYPPFSSLQPHIFQGLKTSADKTYLLTVKSIKGGLCEVETDGGDKIRIEREILKPVVKGEHVQRYFIDRSSGLHIIYPYRISDEGRAVILSQAIMTKEFPFTWEYLKANKAKLCARDGGIWGQRSDWYAYARSQNLSAFLGEKLLLPYMTTRLRVAPDSSGELFFVNITTGGYGMRFDYGKHDSFYVVGILNSKLLDCAIRQMTSAFRGGYFAVNKQGIERLPFRSINFSDRTDKSRHDRLVKMVKQMLDLNHQLTIAKTLHEKTTLQRQIAATDQQIDKLVYELYGLTEEEIKIVEESTDHL